VVPRVSKLTHGVRLRCCIRHPTNVLVPITKAILCSGLWLHGLTDYLLERPQNSLLRVIRYLRSSLYYSIDSCRARVNVVLMGVLRNFQCSRSDRTNGICSLASQAVRLPGTVPFAMEHVFKPVAVQSLLALWTSKTALGLSSLTLSLPFRRCGFPTNAPNSGYF
jgi:hypothetical protein